LQPVAAVHHRDHHPSGLSVSSAVQFQLEVRSRTGSLEAKVRDSGDDMPFGPTGG
jgi:hypothetical protein